MKAKAMGADANAIGTASEQKIDREEKSRMKKLCYSNTEFAGLSDQDLQEMWSERYQFGISQLRMTEEHARLLADRELRAVAETELEFRND